MNSPIAELLKSISITLGISVLVGIAAYPFAGLAGFSAGVLMGCVVQVLVAFLWKSYLVHLSTVEMAAIDSDLRKMEMEQANKHNIDVLCSYCRLPNKVSLRMDEENTFRCNGCNQLNVVVITLSTARVTVPLDLNGDAMLEKAAGPEVKDLSAPVEFRGA